VDGDRDGEITDWGPDPWGNSQVECTACYISTSTDESIWIRIDLVDNYFVTEINVFTGESMKYFFNFLYSIQNCLKKASFCCMQCSEELLDYKIILQNIK